MSNECAGNRFLKYAMTTYHLSLITHHSSLITLISLITLLSGSTPVVLVCAARNVKAR
jgi:hypothetical protein